MKSCEHLIAPESDYFVHVPSIGARELFFYPLYIGHFIYEAGYCLQRDSYDSFLVMYIQKGQLSVTLPSATTVAREGSFLLLDCYEPHAYHTETGCETLWCHFDGALARGWFQTITGQLGNVFRLADPYPALSKLTTLYKQFAESAPLREPLLSKYINDILTAFLIYSPSNLRTPDRDGSMEETITYINEHFAEELPLEKLAAKASLSQYHFIRTFRKETGFTPHEYLVNIRINTAKYLLKNSMLSIKDICFQTGFSCESVFCSAFKKRLGLTPLEYRHSGEPD
ncbi:MAG: helix-turn-helix domain-containing protein [Acetatifactor sp.]